MILTTSQAVVSHKVTGCKGIVLGETIKGANAEVPARAV